MPPPPRPPTAGEETPGDPTEQPEGGVHSLPSHLISCHQYEENNVKYLPVSTVK